MNKLKWGKEPLSQPRKGPHELRDLRTVVVVGLRARVPSGAQTPKQASKQERERESVGGKAPTPWPWRKKKRERRKRERQIRQGLLCTVQG